MIKIMTKTIGTILSVTTLYSASISSDIHKNSLVIYNNNIGLVHEERILNFKKDDNSLIYKGVASSIDIDSVKLTLPKGINLFSQQYRFDKLNLAKLLNAHIGKIVEVKKNNNVINATLLSSDTKNSILKTKQGKIISVANKHIVFKSLPKELLTKPSLVWNLKTERDVNSKMELDYIINNISWKSDYILDISKNKAHLSGWISINNRSGKEFHDTALKLLAGEVNLIKKEQYKASREKVLMSVQNQNIDSLAHEGYHIYEIPFHVNLLNNEKTQIKFFEKSNLKIKREYSSILSNPLYFYGESTHKVTQSINIDALDTQLPKGIIRSYSKLKEETIFLGQNSIQHTPKNTDITLNIGTNFDIKVTQTLLEKSDNKLQRVSTMRYKIKNSSNELKTVKLLIPFNKHKNSLIKTKIPYVYKNGNLVSFELNIPADTEKEFEVTFSAKI